MMPIEDNNIDKFKEIVNVITNPKLNISKIAMAYSSIAMATSAARIQHIPKSDMDVIFSVSGDPRPEDFYPLLIKVLEDTFPYDKVYAGSNYIVVHLIFHDGGKFNLLLLKNADFDKDFVNYLDYRIENL